MVPRVWHLYLLRQSMLVVRDKYILLPRIFIRHLGNLLQSSTASSLRQMHKDIGGPRFSDLIVVVSFSGILDGHIFVALRQLDRVLDLINFLDSLLI